jgi:hypothetical protein
MSTAAIVLLGLTALAGGITLEQHGKPKTGITSIWTWLISVAIQMGILSWGGFFNSVQ